MEQKLTGLCLDQLSMKDIYEKTAPSIFTYLRSRLSSSEQAEDILLEVFLAALESEKFSHLSSDEQFSWLRRVAQHKIIDCYRLSMHQPTMTLEQVDKALSLVSDMSPEQIIRRQEDLSSLQAAINHLPPLQQQVLILRFVNGMRCAEIALLLGKRDGAVRVLLSRAIYRLRELYMTSSKGED